MRRYQRIATLASMAITHFAKGIHRAEGAVDIETDPDNGKIGWTRVTVPLLAFPVLGTTAPCSDGTCAGNSPCLGRLALGHLLYAA